MSLFMVSKDLTSRFIQNVFNFASEMVNFKHFELNIVKNIFYYQEFLNISICYYPGYFIMKWIWNGLVFWKNIQIAGILLYPVSHVMESTVVFLVFYLEYLNACKYIRRSKCWYKVLRLPFNQIVNIIRIQANPWQCLYLSSDVLLGISGAGEG